LLNPALWATRGAGTAKPKEKKKRAGTQLRSTSVKKTPQKTLSGGHGSSAGIVILGEYGAANTKAMAVKKIEKTWLCKLKRTRGSNFGRRGTEARGE